VHNFVKFKRTAAIIRPHPSQQISCSSSPQNQRPQCKVHIRSSDCLATWRSGNGVNRVHQRSYSTSGPGWVTVFGRANHLRT